ncbi:MAG: glycosyltransferase [Actinobacteria bacterium]|nr:glycosyltransferase [Actinomycetota bacterium]MCG2807403.1 glycosyltransferase [Coriobacteriia bacterium]
MKILVVNKFGFVRGGLERVMFDEIDALRGLGHDAELFATAHPENLPHRFAAQFPPYHEIGVAGAAGPAAVRDMFHNAAAAAAISRVIEEFQPDVAHFHGVHRHLSPSVLFAARATGVPTVLTAHDYFAVCPGNTLLRGGTVPCIPRRCGVRLYGAAMVYRCVQDSVSRSALAGLELSYQRVRRAYERGVDRFVAPSAFLAGVLTDGGFDPARVTVVPNAVPVPQGDVPGAAQRAGFLFAGRLSPEKGVDVAIGAAARAGATLSIAGDGPDAVRLSQMGGETRFLGRLASEELSALMRSVRALIVPSVCVENAPMVVLEAMAAGTPVIASAIGGIPEQFEDGVHGLLVAPGDVEALAVAMRNLESDDALVERLGHAARERVKRTFSLERHIESLLNVYRQVGAS